MNRDLWPRVTTNICVRLLIAPCCSRCHHRRRRSQHENVLATTLAIDEIVYFDTEQNCTISVIFLQYGNTCSLNS